MLLVTKGKQYTDIRILIYTVLLPFLLKWMVDHPGLILTIQCFYHLKRLTVCLKIKMTPDFKMKIPIPPRKNVDPKAPKILSDM
jgi:hypothetical protein